MADFRTTSQFGHRQGNHHRRCCQDPCFNRHFFLVAVDMDAADGSRMIHHYFSSCSPTPRMSQRRIASHSVLDCEESPSNEVAVFHKAAKRLRGLQHGPTRIHLLGRSEGEASTSSS